MRSGGNYGKAFATLVNSLERKIKNTVLVPSSAPDDKARLIESLGSVVHRPPTSRLVEEIEKLKQDGYTYVNPVDDDYLISGYSSLPFEIIDQIIQEPDVILVPCGAGGMLASISATLRLVGWSSTAIYGVEPETADSMRQSFKIKRAVCLLELLLLLTSLW